MCHYCTDKLPEFVSPVPDLSLGSGFSQPALGRSGPLYLPTSSLTESGGKIKGLLLQENHHPEWPRVAQHPLILGSGGSVRTDPTVPALFNHSALHIPHHDVANLNLDAWATGVASKSNASLRQC